MRVVQINIGMAAGESTTYHCELVPQPLFLVIIHYGSVPSERPLNRLWSFHIAGGNDET